MIKNSNGVTLIELLISISIGSVILMMLMGILSSSLLAKNEAEYINRLNNEVFYINETIIDIFKEDKYTSIDTYLDNNDVTVLIITEEYSVKIENNTTIRVTQYRNTEDDDYNENYVFQHLLVLDKSVDTNGLYYGPKDEWDESNYRLDGPKTIKLSSPNIIFTEKSEISIRNCVGTFNIPQTELDELIALAPGDYICARAFVEFNFELEYNLVRGNKLSPRWFTTTLFF